PPSVLRPFAQPRCYLRWGDVCHLLGRRYPSFIAPTGPCATPVGLSSPSAFNLVRRVFAGCTNPCCPRELPDVISESLSLDAGSRSPAVHRVLSPVSSTVSSAFPTGKTGRLSASIPRITTSRRTVFRGCRYFVMFRPPSLLAPQIVPTAANTAAGQPGLLRPGISCFVTSARTGYTNCPIQVIDSTGTFTLLDSRPCRLLLSRQRSSPRDACLPSIGSRRERFPDVVSTMKALRLPGHVSPVTYLFRFQGPRYLRNSCLAACAPRGVEDAFQARILVQPVIRLPVFSHVDVPGYLRFPGNPSRAFASVHDPGRTNDPSPVPVSPVLPLLHRQQRLQRDNHIGANAGL